jgi:hypothetical protein
VRAKNSWPIASLVLLAASTMVQAQAAGASPISANAAPAASAALQTGPATVAPHWSKYDYPKSIAEGALYRIVERNDTLWDLAKAHLGNPYLWPQLWHENGYIKDAHWIYPGDPIVFPRVQVVAGQAGAAGEASTGGTAGTGEAGELLPPEQVAGGLTGGAARGQKLVPLTEPTAAQCAPYIADQSEDDGLKVVGHEGDPARITGGTGEVIYINAGSDAGVKPGDVFSIHRVRGPMGYPPSGKRLGRKILTVGWARVILTEAKASSAVIEQACQDIVNGDYLRPFKAVPVPMIPVIAPADRLTPHSGKAHGYVVDLEDRNEIAGAGNFVIIDIGSNEGVTPGTLLQAYRIEHPNVPRNVIADLAVLTVQERTATVKVVHSTIAVMVGDEVEVR